MPDAGPDSTPPEAVGDRATPELVPGLKRLRPASAVRPCSSGFLDEALGLRAGASLGGSVADLAYLSIRTVVAPVFPPAEAEMVTLPSFKARTSPVLLTVARPVLLLAQVNVTPLMTLFAAS